MEKTGIFLLFISCLFFLTPSVMAVSSPVSVANHEMIITATGENSTATPVIPNATIGNEAESSESFTNRLNALRNQSSRITVVDREVLRGKPVYVAKPSSDNLMRTVRIWTFGDEISVSTRSASEFFGRIPLQNESTGMLMSADETNAVIGPDLTIIIEYPAVQGQYDILIDRTTGSVSDNRTGKNLFNLEDKSSLTRYQNIAIFLDAISDERSNDSYAVYHIGMIEPYIRIDPVESVKKGSLLNITGITNLPSGEALIGQLYFTNRYFGSLKPSHQIYIHPGNEDQNTWSWSIKTDDIPSSEYFFRISPADQNIRQNFYGKSFTIFPKNASENMMAYGYERGTSGNLRRCNNTTVFCDGEHKTSIDLAGHYNRIVFSYSPVSINITNATFIKECYSPHSSRVLNTTIIPTTIHRINNKTIIIDPNQILCFTDTGPAYLCDNCHYELDVKFSYPNPPANASKEVIYFTFSTGYLWKDDPEQTQYPIQPDKVTSENRSTNVKNVSELADENNFTPPFPTTQHASISFFIPISAILVIGLLCFSMRQK